MHTIYIKGVMKPQKRGRIIKKGIHYGIKSPKENQESAIMQIIAQAPKKLMEGALCVTFHFYMPRPKSVTLKKRPYPCVKPDLSNLIKGLEDAMNGVVYKDDSQICSLSVEKRYADDGITPGCAISIREI